MMKLLIVLLLLAWAGSFALGMSYYFQSGLPTTRDVTTGRTYPISSGGRVYYLTKRQNVVHVAALVLSFVFLVALVVMRKYVDDPSSRQPGRHIFPPSNGAG